MAETQEMTSTTGEDSGEILTSHPLLVEKWQNIIATLEKSLAISWKIKCKLPYNLEVSHLLIPEE